MCFDALLRCFPSLRTVFVCIELVRLRSGNFILRCFVEKQKLLPHIAETWFVVALARIHSILVSLNVLCLFYWRAAACYAIWRCVLRQQPQTFSFIQRILWATWADNSLEKYHTWTWCTRINRKQNKRKHRINKNKRCTKGNIVIIVSTIDYVCWWWFQVVSFHDFIAKGKSMTID